MQSLEEMHLAHLRALEPVHLGVGRLCGVWADLEGMIRWLYIIALRLPEEQLSYSIVSQIPFRIQLSSIRLGLIENPHCQDVAVRTLESINYIDNVLRPLRNLYVHNDVWIDEDTGEAVWSESAPKLRKPQHAPAFVSHHKVLREPVDAVRDCVREIENETSNLAGIVARLQRPELLDAQFTQFPKRKFSTPA